MAETITPPLVTTDPVVISDLTQKTLGGDGVLDVMLQTMRVHLSDQFEKERIQGTEYATVYLGAYQSTLEAAINFLLAKQKQGLELQLLTAQVSLAEAQEEQIRDQMQKTPYEIQLLQKQVELADKQVEQADRQLDLLDAQIQVQLKQLDLLAEQVEQAKAQTEYYAQRTITEKAQTQAGIAATGSVIGTQVTLMNAQKDGYTRNAEQQATQILVNTWNVRRQTDEDTTANTTNLLDDATVGKSIQTLLKGIGITVTPA